MSFFTSSSLIQFYQLIFGNYKNLLYYFNWKQYNLLLGIWPMTQYSTCFLTSSPIWATGQHACGTRRNIEPSAKYPTINYTAFGWNNMTNFLNYQILADRFVLNLKKWINPRCHFSYWYSIVGHEVMRLLPGTMVHIPNWIVPMVKQTDNIASVQWGFTVYIF